MRPLASDADFASTQSGIGFFLTSITYTGESLVHPSSLAERKCHGHVRLPPAPCHSASSFPSHFQRLERCRSRSEVRYASACCRGVRQTVKVTKVSSRLLVRMRPANVAAGLMFFTAALTMRFERREVFYRETAARFYRPEAFSMSSFAVELPALLIIMLVSVSISYWIVGLKASVGAFFYFYLNGVVLALFFLCVGLVRCFNLRVTPAWLEACQWVRPYRVTS